MILLFPQAGTASSKTGDADDTISLDSKRCLWMEPVFERLQQRQPQDKVLLNLNCAEYLLLLRRAAANLQVDMVPYQGRHSGASVDRAENLRTLESIQEPRTMEISQVCAPLREKRTCQPKLVRARSIGPGKMRALQQPPALSIASRSRLSDTASTAPSFVIDLFSANTDLQQFFLNRDVQCAKLDFSDVLSDSVDNAQTQLDDTSLALSDAAHSFALLRQFIENELTQDSKALTEKTLEVFHGPYLDQVAHVSSVDPQNLDSYEDSITKNAFLFTLFTRTQTSVCDATTGACDSESTENSGRPTGPVH